MKIALYPGSFDPFTSAHEQIVKDALTIFDKVVVAVGNNVSKQSLLSVEKRVAIIDKVFKAEKERVEAVCYDTLTVEFCKERQINHIIRGVRNFGDFEFETNIAFINHMLNPDVMTIYLCCNPSLKAVSSTAVREILKFGGNPTAMLPSGITVEDLAHDK